MTPPTYRLNDGTDLPQVGFGTWPLKGPDAVRATVGAIEAGYRLLDSAVNYENEADVAEAMRVCGLDRDALAFTTRSRGASTRTTSRCAAWRTACGARAWTAWTWC